MFNIRTELSSGASSKGYDRDSLEEAEKCFSQVAAQLTAANFVGAVVMSEEGVDVQRVVLDAPK